MPIVLEKCKLYAAGLDMSGDMNALSLDLSSDQVDFTTFGDETKRNALGLRKNSFSHNGLWNGGAGLSDEAIFSALSNATTPMTICPVDGVQGDVAYMVNSVVSKYSPAAKIGEAFAFTVSGENADENGCIRGSVLLSSTAIVTGSGGSLNLGNVSASQSLYATLHVIDVQGTTPSLTARVQSATDSIFTTPVTRITFSAAIAIGAQWATEVAGAITAPWWRVDYTISGTASPSFTFIVSIGIQ